MQKNVPVNPLPLSLNPIKDALGVSAVDYSADFDHLFRKSENLEKFYETGKASSELVRYLPGLTKPLYQGQLKGTTERKAFADDTYKDLKVAEYTVQLSNNEYMNFHGVHLVFPMKIKKKSNVANDILAGEITVNNFFAHWIKEIDIKCLGDDIPILPTTNTIPIYRYSNRLLKHMPKDSLAIIENNLLYSKKKVKLPAGEDKRDTHTAAGGDANNRTDDNIDERIQKFQNQLKNTYWYRVPLKYIVDIGQVNTPIKFHNITFETDLQKLFESKTDRGVAGGLPDNVDAKIILESTPYLLYYQFELEDTFRTYLESAMISNQVLKTGIFLTPHQKSYELVIGAQSKTFTFQNVFKQFAFLEFSLIFDRSDQLFDSCLIAVKYV